MYVCLCRGITDCTVRLAIEAGARDIDTVARLSGAGGRCGGCRSALASLLAAMTGTTVARFEVSGDDAGDCIGGGDCAGCENGVRGSALAAASEN